MDQAAFDGWRSSMTPEALKRCRGLYLYRRFPLIDMRAIQEHSHIEVLEGHPVDWAGIARRHGGGKYRIMMAYTGATADKKAQMDFEVSEAEHEPIIDLRTLKTEEPGNRAYVGKLKRKGILDIEGKPVPTERDQMSAVLQTLVEKATGDTITGADLRAAIAENGGGQQKEMLAMFGPIFSKLAEASLAPREVPPAEGFDIAGLAALMQATKPDQTLLLELLRQRQEKPNGGIEETLGVFERMFALGRSMGGGSGDQHWTANLAQPLAEGMRTAAAYFNMRAAAAGGATLEDQEGAEEEEPPQAVAAAPNPLLTPIIGFLESAAPVLLPMIQSSDKTGADACQMALPYFRDNAAVAEALLAVDQSLIVDCFDQAPAYSKVKLSESRLRAFVGEFVERLAAIKREAMTTAAAA